MIHDIQKLYVALKDLLAIYDRNKLFIMILVEKMEIHFSVVDNSKKHIPR